MLCLEWQCILFDADSATRLWVKNLFQQGKDSWQLGGPWWPANWEGERRKQATPVLFAASTKCDSGMTKSMFCREHSAIGTSWHNRHSRIEDTHVLAIATGGCFSLKGKMLVNFPPSVEATDRWLLENVCSTQCGHVVPFQGSPPLLA